MAIKNSDGSECYFTKPNPLLINQDLWNKDEITLEGNFSNRIVFTASKSQIVEDVEEIQIVQSIIKKQEDEIIQKKDDVIDVWCLTNKNKFKIKGKVWDSQDLYIQLITKQVLSDGTIIFPLNNERRWWRVINTNKMPEEGFYLAYAEISDYQPSFSS